MYTVNCVNCGMSLRESTAKGLLNKYKGRKIYCHNCETNVKTKICHD